MQSSLSRTKIFKQNLRITQLGKTGQIEEAIRVFKKITHPNTVTYNSMISAYAKNGRIKQARVLFDKMPHKNLVSWNTLINGYIYNDQIEQACKLFEKMPQWDFFTYALMITCYSRNGALDKARNIFYSLPDMSNVACWNAMITGYTQNGEMELGVKFFNEMEEKDIVSWNMVVCGFVDLGDLDSAWEFFEKIPCPNVVSWVTMLSGYARYGGFVRVGKLEEAKNLLDAMPYQNVGAQTAMISGYVQHNMIDEGRKIFDQMSSRDIACWNTMITGYARSGKMDEALYLFKKMEHKSVVIWNTMIAGYAQAGKMENSFEMFENMRERNVMSWNSLISGFTQNGLYVDAVKSFVSMSREGKKPDQSTFTSALSSCGNLALEYTGRQLHQAIIRNVVSWNSLIAGYALNGYGKEAVKLFQDMEGRGMDPDEVTFIGVLSACNHAGLIDLGVNLFESMSKKYPIEPLTEHYACMLDLLGRAGRLKEAFELVSKMKVKVTPGIWSSLLWACRMHKNAELASFFSTKLIKIEPHKTSNLVLVANMYAEIGKWNEVERVRETMIDKRGVKQPGCSWIEDKNQLIVFLADDDSRAQKMEIRDALKSLTAQMMDAVCIPVGRSSFLDIG
nr:pentatricopeptide repeat-containing protein At4g02750-like [Ipomoea batatas]